MRNYLVSTLNILLLFLIAASIGIHQGRLVGYSLEPETKTIQPPTITEVKKLFSDADSLRKEGEVYLVRAGEKKLGRILDSRGMADDITGYAGPTPVFIGIAEDNNVVGILLQDNAESPEFIEKVREKNILASWTGKNIQETGKVKVDAVSGATMSSLSIIQTVQKVLESQTKVKSAEPKASIWDWKAFLALAVLAFALVSFFCPAKIRKIRIWQQIVNIVILGFILGWFVSMAQLYACLVYGLQWRTRPVSTLMILCVLIIPLITRHGFYCIYLCPFGSCQELLGKIPIKKYQLPKWAGDFRLMVFSTILMLLVIGISIDLTNVEPFSAFIFSTAATAVFVIASISLILSLFFNRPWCNIACPTGQFLEILRNVFRKPLPKADEGDAKSNENVSKSNENSPKGGENKMKPMEVVSILLAVALIIVLLQTGGIPSASKTEDSAKPQVQKPNMQNETLSIIHQRKSVRKYTNQPVTNEQVVILIKAAMAAPTAMNKQPWVFIAVTDKNTLAKLAEVLPYTKMAAQASVAIVVCGDMTQAISDPIAQAFWIQDCSAATQNLLLAAESMGLGAVWTGIYPMPANVKSVKEVLGLPDHIIPLNVIPVGYPTGEEKPKDKYKPEKIHWEKW